DSADRRPVGGSFCPVDRRQPGRLAASAHVASGHRLELRPAERGGACPVPASECVCRRLDSGSGGGGLCWRWGGGVGSAGSVDAPGGEIAGGVRGASGGNRALSFAGDDAAGQYGRTGGSRGGTVSAVGNRQAVCTESAEGE